MRELISFVSDVDSPHMGITADLYHMSKEDPDIPQALEEANGLIWHVHLSDTDRLTPGEGTLDFPKIIAKLRELNYSKYLSLEIKSSLIVEETLLKVNKFTRRTLQ
jgi:sugar phosphate isomerase/epimerase